MKSIGFVWIFIALLPVFVYGQSVNNFDKVWVDGAGVSHTTTFYSSGPITQFLDTFYSPYFSQGHSNICDSFGNLVLCSDGCSIYNKNCDTIEGGGRIVPDLYYAKSLGASFYSQSSLILPFPNNKYYVVTPVASDNEITTYWNNPNLGRALFDELLYSIVDMNANSGAGKVVRKKVPLLQNVELSKAQMMACRHGDGKDWWLLKQASDTNLIYKFIFTKDTVYGPYIQGFPQPHFTKWDINGQSAISIDGTKYVTGVEGDGTDSGTGWIFLADFDRCSGFLSNPKVFKLPPVITHNPYDTAEKEQWVNGLAFSPNGRYLYIAQRYNIQQIDLLSANPQNTLTVVGGLDTLWNYFQTYTTLYLGPDNKLYIGNWNGFSDGMSVINNPDNGGLACNFCPRCLRAPIFYSSTNYITGVTSPPNMPYYRLGPTIPPCSLAVDVVKEEDTVSVYPNPTHGRFSVSVKEGGNLIIIDIRGRIVSQHKLRAGNNELTMPDNAADGLYIGRYTSKDGREQRNVKINYQQ